MHTFLIASQYLENYGTRFKPKGGRNFVVDAPCVFSAVALVHQFLFTEQASQGNGSLCHEFPLMPDIGAGGYQYEFVNASHAIAQIPEYERDENIRLVWGEPNRPLTVL